MSRPQHADRFFLGITIVLLCVGFFIFTSASLGLLGRNEANFGLIALKQLVILIVGLVAMALVAQIHYKGWRQIATPFLLLTLIFTTLVFIPGLGLEIGGSKRWIGLGPLSFQPSEFLKLAFIVYVAAWLGAIKDKITSFKRGFLPFMLLLAIVAAPIIMQPDTGTFMTLFAAAIAMFIAAGGRWMHLGIILLAGVVLIAAMAFYKPHVRARITTYLNPTADTRGAGYQINQSLIAIGSGGITGRGFGQSVQKFAFLPEPIGDSIFAVASEEFGLVGSVLIVILFMIFALWGLKIANRAPDAFSRLLVVGIVILITAQSYINVAAMLGLIPLTGVPLIFISHGGSALLMALVAVGIVLNISRYT